MSVDLPVCALVFGSVTPPQADVLDLKVHLGATKEVSSFNCLLKNFNKKYSPGGTYPINVGDDGSVSIGRGASNPLIATITVEEIRAISNALQENYIRVLGRCWGERLFRRVVTKTYESQKGEAIVKDIIDNYVGLSHVRNTTELIENTDTTYTLLEYENTPVFDILKYIASSADLAGVIGFDFRVAPDGKFEFFARNSKTSSVSLSERLEVSEYRKSIFRKRDKIFVYGAAEKIHPSDEIWTESLSGWNDQPTLTLDGSDYVVGDYSIRRNRSNQANWYERTFSAIQAGPFAKQFKKLSFWVKAQGTGLSINVYIYAPDWNNRFTRVWESLPDDEWAEFNLDIGPEAEANGVWRQGPLGNPDWNNIQGINIEIVWPSTGAHTSWLDGLFFMKARWSAEYGSGQRELAATDEELHSDNECLLRAKALYDYLSGTAEYIKVTSDVIDYGTTPILAGDRIWVSIPNENVDGYYRVISAEYHIRARDQTLEVTLELGKEPMLLANYLYRLRKKMSMVTRLKKGVKG